MPENWLADWLAVWLARWLVDCDGVQVSESASGSFKCAERQKLPTKCFGGPVSWYRVPAIGCVCACGEPGGERWLTVVCWRLYAFGRIRFFVLCRVLNMRPGQMLFLGLLTAVQAGCRYDGAFMQMDSNAPFPFFGFQLAVDSGIRPARGVDVGAGSRQRREDIVPLYEGVSEEFDVPIPHFQPLQEQATGRGVPSMPVSLRR